ncbi:DUF1934 domain-containing protein [Lactobacillus xylocopicola]|uniref:DUF1934 domain-containing protein n=1 Tax=Lactobacillus xylocopicola TaxID=2976676 RepID=A0ABN6SKY8_9LACO|nr:DUF1934 domain-containing protein [Lactobacillus xylocopicola]BDR60980.1 hypothetical protein KIM322_12410 [Lactobacillus xylocopicola]
MTKIKVDFISQITQENESATFQKTGIGELNQAAGVTRVAYLEEGRVPVKVLIRQDDVIIRRGSDNTDYSQLHFKRGEQKACRYVAQGYQMDLKSQTKVIEFFTKNDGTQQLQIEYDLFSGLYLVGNYVVTLIFT